MPTFDVDVEGVTYEVDAPNQQLAWQWANYTHEQKKAAKPAAKPATGLLPAVGKGIESLVSAGRTAAGAVFGSPEEAARAGLERQKEMGEKYADQVSLEKVKQAYEKSGLLSAAGEAISQVPYAIAEQAPNIAASIGSAATGARLGAMAGAPFGGLAGSGIGALIGGGIGAFAPSFIQQLGGNIERQADVQTKAGKPLDISMAGAAGAAVPQALLDVAGTYIPLGKTVIGKVFGPEVKALLERGEKGAAEALAKESLLKTAGKGTFIGAAAEIPTEVSQTVLERAQAGLPLTDDDALKEYGETTYQVGLLGPIGAAGRAVDKRAARTQIAAEQQTKAAEAAKAAADAEAAKKASPDYALALEGRYNEAVTQMRQLQEAVKQKPGKDATPDERAEYQQNVDALKAFINDTMRPLTQEYAPRKAEIAKIKEQQRIAGLTPLEYQMEQFGVDLKAPPEEQRVFTGEEAPPAAKPPEVEYAERQMALAKSQDMGTFTEADYAQYLMQDPDMAQKLVASNTPIPGLSKQESNAVLGGIKLQLKEQEKQAKQQTEEQTRTEFEQRQADLAAQKQSAKATDPLALWKASLEQTEEQATEELLRPNFEAALEPSGPPKVAVAPGITPIQNPDTLVKRLDELTAQRDKAAADADTAFAAGNKELGAKKAQEREAAQNALNQVEQTEGPGRAILALRKAQDAALMDAASLVDDLKAGRTLGGRPMPSREAFATDEEYAAAVQEERDRRGTASSTPRTLVNKINAVRDRFITAAVQEAAATRRLYGKSLTQEEATKAGDQIREVFNEWVTRSMAQPAKSVNLMDKMLAYFNAEQSVSQAPYPTELAWVKEQRDAYIKTQLDEALANRLGRQRVEEISKGTAELKGAETELPADTKRAIVSKAMVDFNRMVVEAQKKAFAQSTDPRPLEERRFGAYKAATQVLQEQLRGIANKLKEVPRAPQRVEPPLKMQFPSTEAAKVAEASGETAKTAEGALRRRREYVGDLIDQAFQTRRVPGIADALLTRARDFLQEPLAIKTVDETTGEETIRYQPRGTTALLDAAQNIADRLIRGQNIERSDLVTLRNELRAESARPGAGEVVGERVGQRELFSAEERRAPLGVIRETRRNFENAPIVKRARAAAERARQLVSDIKEAWGAFDAAKAKVQAGKVAGAEARVEQRRADLQEAFSAALQKARLDAVVGKFQPQIDAVINQLALLGKERAKALRAKDVEAAADFNTIIEVERAELQRLRDEMNRARQAPGTVLEQAEVQWQRGKPGEKQRVLREATLPHEVTAAADEWVQFERERLAKAEAALAKLKGPERTTQAKAVAEQRTAVREAETVTQRAREGLGLPGVRRVAGKTEAIETAQAREEARAEEEKERRERVREEAAASAAAKEEQRAALENRILDLGTEIENQKAAFKRAKTQESKTRIGQQIVELTKQAELAQAQLEAFGETKPRRKGPATVVSGQGLSRQRPLRTGYRKALESAAEGMRAEREGNVEIPGTFEFGPQDTLFSRGPTENPSTADSVRAELGRVFPDTGRVQIFDSVDALLAQHPEYEGKIPSDARGFVDPKTNRAFLIAENINKGQALSVLLHEVGSHIGLKNALGEAQYNALVKAVESWEKRNDGSIESRVAKAARERVEAAQTKPGQVSDELLAYAIEEAVNAGVKPTETKGILGQWLSRVAALFRKALEKFGLPSKALDAQGLVDMAFGAAKLEMQEDGMLPTPKRERSLMDIVPRLQKETGTPIGLSGFIADTSAPFNNMTFAEAARFGLKSAKGETKKLLFQKLVDVFEQAPEGVKQGRVLATNGMRNKRATYIAAFNSHLNEVYTPHTERNGWLDTMLHELTHAATYYGLSTNKELNSQVEDLRLRVRYWANTPEGKRKARSIFNLVNPETKEIYGLKNTDEFVAETFSNRAFQKLLALIPSDKPAKSIFTKFVEAVSNAIGLTSPKERTALAEAIALTEEAMDTTAERVYTKPEKLPAQRTRTVGAEEILFSRNLPTASRVADALIAAEPTLTQRIKDSFNGFRTQFIDKLFPAEEALKRGKVDENKAMQANYYLRMYDMRNHFVSQAIATGAPELRELTRPDARKERLIEAKPGANISQVVDILKQPAVAKAAGSPDAANKLFTLYLAGLRAKRVGIDTLNFGGKVKQADLDAAMAEIDANPTLKKAFGEARTIYNQYNKDLINFAVEAGSIGKDHAKRLLANDDYIPYYRVRDGVAQMIIGKETPVRIGNLKDSPHLQELVGGDEAIFDFLTSSVQNTAMLLDMSMRNLATKNLMYELRDVGLATVSKETKGKAPSNAVTFKKDGEDHFAIVNTDAIGIDSDLLVKGLAGIPTMFPSFVRVMGIPARLLRRMVVAAPPYWGKQLFRDSLAGSIASGADMVPMLDALKQIGKPGALERRGITGGQVFTGMPEDITNMLKDMQAGKISLTSGLGWLEAKSAAADALTRRAQYESYRKQGRSEMEATLMALESMNFSRRGLSPTVHMMSTLIPFLNSQIQSLDVLYRAFTGKMPMNERLDIRRKLFERGMMLAGLSFSYAAAMGDDDEAYKNARPEEKYGNWFVPIPGMKEPLRVPIPFEIGYIFKALPEAIVNTMRSKEGGEEALKALKYITVQTIPGASSYFVPQAVKPAMETLLDRSFFTGRELESAREKMLEPGYRARDNTTELAKWLGEATNVSPIKMENLVRGYTGGMGMAFLQALSAPLAGAGPEGPTKRVTDLPVIGTLFQPADASGIVDAVYEKVNDARKIQATYKDMLAKGRVADAQAYLNKHVEEQAAMAVEGSFRQQMAKIMQYEQSIRVSSMTPQEKRDALDKAKQAKITLASAVREMLGRTTPQAARP